MSKYSGEHLTKAGRVNAVGGDVYQETSLITFSYSLNKLKSQKTIEVFTLSFNKYLQEFHWMFYWFSVYQFQKNWEHSLSAFLFVCFDGFQKFKHNIKLSYRNICWEEDCLGQRCCEQWKNNDFISRDYQRDHLLFFANMLVKGWKWLQVEKMPVSGWRRISSQAFTEKNFFMTKLPYVP